MMLEINFVLLIAIFWCIFQDCQSEDCVDYENSDVHDDCGELRIENGQSCYTKLNVSGKQRWEAIIKCLEGFELCGISTRKCTRDRSSVFTWDDRKIKCIQVDTPTCTSAAPITTLNVSRASTTTSTKTTKSSTKTFTSSTNTVTSSTSGIVTSEDTRSANAGNKKIAASFLFVQITIATAVSILVIILIVTFIRWRKKMVVAKSKNRQNNNVRVVTNNAYDGSVFSADTVPLPEDEAGINSPEYVYILDRTAEYQKVHTDEERTNPNYNSVQVHSNVYDVATTSCRCNAQRTTHTYSHLNNTNLGNDQSCLTDEPGNVYNSLKDDRRCLKKLAGSYCTSIQINSQGVKMNENGLNTYYDRTNNRMMEPSKVDIDTYAHAINNL